MKRDLDVARTFADSITPEALEKLVHYGQPELDPTSPELTRLREMFSGSLCKPSGEPE
jgi:hypothetical protein